jgi:hypothetical protein
VVCISVWACITVGFPAVGLGTSFSKNQLMSSAGALDSAPVWVFAIALGSTLSSALGGGASRLGAGVVPESIIQSIDSGFSAGAPGCAFGWDLANSEDIGKPLNNVKGTTSREQHQEGRQGSLS